MNSSRWKRAQEAELQHKAHQSGFPPEDHIKSRFTNYWDSDVASLENEVVLAVGSGTGMIHTFEDTERSIALDPLNDKLQIDGSKAENVVGVGEQLPFDSGEFDTAISYNVLDHTAEPERVLTEIQRVLNSNGRLLVLINTFPLPKFIRKRLGLIDRPHPHHFRPSEIMEMLSRTNFSVSHFQSNPRFTDRSLRKIINGGVKILGARMIPIERTCVVARPIVE